MELIMAVIYGLTKDCQKEQKYNAMDYDIISQKRITDSKWEGKGIFATSLILQPYLAGKVSVGAGLLHDKNG